MLKNPPKKISRYLYAKYKSDVHILFLPVKYFNMQNARFHLRLQAVFPQFLHI